MQKLTRYLTPTKNEAIQTSVIPNYPKFQTFAIGKVIISA